ncbi:carbon-nitrogen hydrolase family protein [Actinokineospora xionganensis]|uniref:Carbon-nitrogen hydrolase family protein n=1 Tax=Actinokineospora xionganensis TaxID=2684470 RepID=A0ABR7LF35_9PSEU|nr:carbon-nitrogen hydrolase family protein [Actinokineospora xionganensis]MBC6450892.1 carbon-nitrogen hydrolase family protein [Actinokineospora xionganensis]
MPKSLSIAVAQPRCVPYDVEANAAIHAATVAAAGARVVVFPELSLTGYELDAPAITADDPRLAPIVEACARSGSLALVGAPVQGDGGAAHIATLAVDETGVRVAYRKMWLGGAEPTYFAPGDQPAVVEVDGHRLGLAICKDLNTPRHAVDTAALGIDGYVASILETVDATAKVAARAEAIAVEHRVWVAVASFAGSTGGGFDHAAGRSGILRPDGVLVSAVDREPGAIAKATLS